MVDGGVGLNRVHDRKVVGRRHLPMERADDAGRDGPLEPEWASEREHRVADSDRARVTDVQWLE